jgi:hypothetical protein
MQEISGDASMKSSAERVLSELKSYAKKEIDANMVRSILKIQDLVAELNN